MGPSVVPVFVSHLVPHHHYEWTERPITVSPVHLDMGSKVKAEFIIIIYYYILKPSEAQWSYAVAELVQ